MSVQYPSKLLLSGPLLEDRYCLRDGKLSFYLTHRGVSWDAGGVVSVHCPSKLLLSRPLLVDRTCPHNGKLSSYLTHRGVGWDAGEVVSVQHLAKLQLSRPSVVYIVSLSYCLVHLGSGLDADYVQPKLKLS